MRFECDAGAVETPLGDGLLPKTNVKCEQSKLILPPRDLPQWM